MARIPVQKANGTLAVETAIVSSTDYTFSNRGSATAFFVIPAAAIGKVISVNTFRNSGGKSFDAAPETLPIQNVANELYIIANLLPNVFNNANSQVEFSTTGAGTMIVVDKAS